MMLNKKILAIITFITSVIIATSGYFYYLNLEKSIHDEKKIDLTAIAQLKINQLVQWKRERTADIRVFSQSPSFSESIEQWIADPENKPLSKYVKERLAIPKEEYNYQSIFVVSPSGEILFSIESDLENFDPLLADKIHQTVKENKEVQSLFYFCETEQVIHFDIIAPILNSKEETIAILIFRVDPADYLYPLIQSWPTPSKTSETLLIREEKGHVIFLNELRHQKNTALKLTIPITQKTLPAVMAAEGVKGIVEGTDYRGSNVMAYVAPIPGSDWYMVSKVDKKELFRDLISRGTFIFFSTVLIILLFGVGLALFYNLRQKNIYRSLFETQEEYKTTLYSIGDAVITTDKWGKVRQINKVAEELTGWTEHEALDQPLTKIFNIVNETSHRVVQNPVEKVLKDGVIVGLANHTMLISKNGDEVPIADSAAPIRDKHGEIIGVVLVFRDQFEERKHLEAIESERDFAESIITTLHESLLVLDADLKVVSANQTFYQTFLFSPKEIIGKPIFKMSKGIWNDPRLRELLETILPENTKFDNFDITYHFDHIGKRVLNMNARRIYTPTKKTKNILLAINDITEKQQLIEDLIIAKEKAEESNQLKTAFLANMSHEIRTPLNGILGFSGMIADDDLSINDKQHFLNIIENSGHQLLSIVNDILDISLIQSNQIKIKNQEFKLEPFLNELFTFYKTLKKDQIKSVGFSLDYNSQHPDLLIKTDKERLLQIFKNLLENAFKFTSSGNIRFGATPSNGEITFFVKDSGKGIPMEKINIIFEKFQQVDIEKGKGIDGTGLGLAISKGLVERLGGEIWVKSELGKGAEFFFRLPLTN